MTLGDYIAQDQIRYETKENFKYSISPTPSTVVIIIIIIIIIIITCCCAAVAIGLRLLNSRVNSRGSGLSYTHTHTRIRHADFVLNPPALPLSTPAARPPLLDRSPPQKNDSKRGGRRNDLKYGSSEGCERQDELQTHFCELLSVAWHPA